MTNIQNSNDLLQIKTNAELGDANSQYQLALLENDDKATIKWMKCAAKNGHVDAQYELGFAYEMGDFGLRQNDKLAFKWYWKAANQGHACSQNNLGFMYECGHGVKQDDKNASFWFLEAAKHRRH